MLDPGSKKDNILEIVCWKYSQNYFLKFPPTEEENLSTNQPSPGVVMTTTTPKPNQGPGGSPMLIQKQNSSQASPSPHFSPVPQIQVIDPNIELMKKQEAEKLRIQKEQLENQQKQLAEQQANAQRQQAEMVKKQQEEMKKQQDAIKQQQEAFEKQRQDQMAAQAKMLEQQKLQMQQQQQQQQLEQQKQMAAQQEALKLQQEKLKMEQQNQQAPKAPITQQPISNVQIKTSLIENQIQMNQIQMATTSAPSGGIQIATTSAPSVGNQLNKADALNLNSQMELLKKQQEELKRQQLEFEKQKAGLIANANPAISTSTTTQVTTTSTSTITHPSYIRPLIGQQPLTSVLQTSDMEIDPLMYNWRTRERQWEMEELDREKQLELERERSTNFCKLQREKARKENEKTLKDIEAGLYGLEDGFKVKVNNNQNNHNSNPSPNKKNNAVAPSNKDSGQHNPPKSNQQSLSSHHQPSGPKSDKVLELAKVYRDRFVIIYGPVSIALELASKSLFLFLFPFLLTVF